MSVRAKLWARQVRLHSFLQCRRPDLDRFAYTSAPLQGKSERRLPCRRRLDHRMPTDQNPLSATANVSLIVPGFGALADEENEALDLSIPVLLGALLGVWKLAYEGLSEFRHTAGFLSVSIRKSVCRQETKGQVIVNKKNILEPN